jgi:hypothetical protein
MKTIKVSEATNIQFDWLVTRTECGAGGGINCQRATEDEDDLFNDEDLQMLMDRDMGD